MIVTVTVNPAIDNTLEIDNFAVGNVNRILSTREDAGGKGINVSKTIHSLEGNTIALGFVGGENGTKIRDYLYLSGVNCDFVTTNANTRRNIKVVDNINKTTTDINEKGLPVDEKYIKMFLRKLYDYSKTAGFVVLSGSLTPNMPHDFYESIAKDIGGFTNVAIDCDGNVFQKALNSAPFIIKPNEKEFAKAFNLSGTGDEILIRAAKDAILTYNIRYVMISKGKNGSLLISSDRVLKSLPVDITAKCTVGPGDAMLAGFLLEYSKSGDELAAYKYACSCGTAAAMTEGTKAIKKEQVNEILQKITVIELE